MLVMTIIFISKMEGLPPTSDIKMIDIWLVLCQLVPFTEVILLTAMEYQRKDTLDEAKDIVSIVSFIDEEDEEKTKQQWSKSRKYWFPQLKTLGEIICKIYLINL